MPTITGTVRSMILRSSSTLRRLRNTRSSASLRPRQHALALVVVGDLLSQGCEDFRLFGPRPHDVLITEQHVDELRQLIQAVLAEHPADGRHSGVVALGPNLSCGVALLRVHGAELVQGEGLAPQVRWRRVLPWPGVRRSRPTRVCLYTTAPREVSLMSTAIRSMRGRLNARPSAATMT